MRTLLLVVLLSGLVASGCIWKRQQSPAAQAPAPATVAGTPATAFAPLPVEPAQAPGQASVPTAQNLPATEQKSQPASEAKLIVTPENALVGKVATVNTTARFVVLSFPLGRLPGMEQRLNVNRRGLRVGEVKITGPQQDENIVADIVVGDAEAGDEVRDH